MRSRQTSPTKQQLTIVIVVTMLALVSWRFFPTPGQWLGDTVFRPLLHGENALRAVIGPNDETLSFSEKIELKELRAENESLRSLLGAAQETRIAASVIGRPAALPYDVLMIDKGSRDGVLSDVPVYANERTVIGFVTAVYERSSLVALVSTPGFTSTTYIFGPNIYATAVGIGGGVTRIHVPQGIKLSEGDVVVIPSLSGGSYGQIGVVDSVPELPEQYGYVTTDLPINSLKNVAIGTKPLSVIDFETARHTVENAKRDFLMVDIPEDMLVDIGVGTSTEEMATSTEETP